MNVFGYCLSVRAHNANICRQIRNKVSGSIEFGATTQINRFGASHQRERASGFYFLPTTLAALAFKTFIISIQTYIFPFDVTLLLFFSERLTSTGSRQELIVVTCLCCLLTVEHNKIIRINQRTPFYLTFFHFCIF